MAQIVAAYGLPHTPFFPSKVEEEGPSSPTGIMFGKARDSLAAAKPDVIVIFDTDHYNTFFFDNFPILAIGIDEGFRGPIDEPRGGMTVYDVTIDAEARRGDPRSGRARRLRHRDVARFLLSIIR